MKSKLLFETFSNGSKSVNLVSHSLLAYDTRYPSTGGTDRAKHNVFDCILQPSKTGTNRASLQLELHYRYGRKDPDVAGGAAWGVNGVTCFVADPHASRPASRWCSTT